MSGTPPLSKRLRKEESVFEFYEECSCKKAKTSILLNRIDVLEEKITKLLDLTSKQEKTIDEIGEKMKKNFTGLTMHHNNIQNIITSINLLADKKVDRSPTTWHHMKGFVKPTDKGSA